MGSKADIETTQYPFNGGGSGIVSNYYNVKENAGDILFLQDAQNKISLRNVEDMSVIPSSVNNLVLPSNISIDSDYDSEKDLQFYGVDNSNKLNKYLVLNNTIKTTLIDDSKYTRYEEDTFFIGDDSRILKDTGLMCPVNCKKKTFIYECIYTFDEIRKALNVSDLEELSIISIGINFTEPVKSGIKITVDTRLTSSTNLKYTESIDSQSIRGIDSSRFTVGVTTYFLGVDVSLMMKEPYKSIRFVFCVSSSNSEGACTMISVPQANNDFTAHSLVRYDPTNTVTSICNASISSLETIAYNYKPYLYIVRFVVYKQVSYDFSKSFTYIPKFSNKYTVPVMFNASQSSITPHRLDLDFIFLNKDATKIDYVLRRFINWTIGYLPSPIASTIIPVSSGFSQSLLAIVRNTLSGSTDSQLALYFISNNTTIGSGIGVTLFNQKVINASISYIPIGTPDIAKGDTKFNRILVFGTTNDGNNFIKGFILKVPIIQGNTVDIVEYTTIPDAVKSLTLTGMYPFKYFSLTNKAKIAYGIKKAQPPIDTTAPDVSIPIARKIAPITAPPPPPPPPPVQQVVTIVYQKPPTGAGAGTEGAAEGAGIQTVTGVCPPQIPCPVLTTLPRYSPVEEIAPAPTTTTSEISQNLIKLQNLKWSYMMSNNPAQGQRNKLMQRLEDLERRLLNYKLQNIPINADVRHIIQSEMRLIAKFIDDTK